MAQTVSEDLHACRHALDEAERGATAVVAWADLCGRDSGGMEEALASIEQARLLVLDAIAAWEVDAK